MRNKLVRGRDGMIAGVCSGIAKFFDLDPTLVRLVYAVLTFFTAFSGIILYVLLWIIVPKEGFELRD